jgi:hypothetical protein
VPGHDLLQQHAPYRETGVHDEGRTLRRGASQRDDRKQQTLRESRLRVSRIGSDV